MEEEQDPKPLSSPPSPTLNSVPFGLEHGDATLNIPLPSFDSASLRGAGNKTPTTTTSYEDEIAMQEALAELRETKAATEPVVERASTRTPEDLIHAATEHALSLMAQEEEESERPLPTLPTLAPASASYKEPTSSAIHSPVLQAAVDAVLGIRPPTPLELTSATTTTVEVDDGPPLVAERLEEEEEEESAVEAVAIDDERVEYVPTTIVDLDQSTAKLPALHCYTTHAVRVAATFGHASTDDARLGTFSVGDDALAEALVLPNAQNGAYVDIDDWANHWRKTDAKVYVLFFSEYTAGTHVPRSGGAWLRPAILAFEKLSQELQRHEHEHGGKAWKRNHFPAKVLEMVNKGVKRVLSHCGLAKVSLHARVLLMYFPSVMSIVANNTTFVDMDQMEHQVNQKWYSTEEWGHWLVTDRAVAAQRAADAMIHKHYETVDEDGTVRQNSFSMYDAIVIALVHNTHAAQDCDEASVATWNWFMETYSSGLAPMSFWTMLWAGIGNWPAAPERLVPIVGLFRAQLAAMLHDELRDHTAAYFYNNSHIEYLRRALAMHVLDIERRSDKESAKHREALKNLIDKLLEMHRFLFPSNKKGTKEFIKWYDTAYHGDEMHGYDKDSFVEAHLQVLRQE